MKSFSAAVALLGFASEAEARINSYSRSVLNQANNRHHVKYGQGGADYIEAHETALYNHKHKLGKTLKSSQHAMLRSNIKNEDGQVIYVVNGKEFAADDASNKLISFLYELQFDKEGAFDSCALVGTEMVEVTNNIKDVYSDFQFQDWFIGVAYLPSHTVFNSLALTEYCNFGSLADSITPFTPTDASDWKTYDIPGMTNTITRTAFAGLVDTKKYRKELEFARQSGDSMAVGTFAAKVFKIFTAFELPPIAEIAPGSAAGNE
jgi:hypothetical protein